MWIAVCLSSLPVGVATAFDRGLFQPFLSLQLVYILVLIDPGRLVFVPVLVQDVAFRTRHGRLFAAPASLLAWGDFFI